MTPPPFPRTMRRAPPARGAPARGRERPAHPGGPDPVSHPTEGRGSELPGIRCGRRTPTLDPLDEAIHEQTPIHQLRHPEPARRAASRSGHRRPRDPDLPDHVLRLPRLRSRRGAVQRRAARPRLLAHHQSHHRGARGAGRGARRRSRGHRHRERTGRDAPRDRHHRGGGRARRRFVRALRRLAQPALLHPAPLRHRDDVRRPAQPRRVSRRHPPRDPAGVRRDPRQPRPRRPRHPGRRRGRARRGPAAPPRLDVHHAVPAASVRSRRGPRHALGDEVPRGPRRGDRRGAGRRRHLRLGRLGPVSDPDRALRRLPRHGVHRRVRPRRVHHARSQGRRPGLRRVHEPHHRVPHPAGGGDAVAAHGAARLEHSQGGRLPERPRRGRERRPSRASGSPRPRAREEAAAARLRGGVQLRARRRTRSGPEVHRVAARLLPSRQRR